MHFSSAKYPRCVKYQTHTKMTKSAIRKLFTTRHTLKSQKSAKYLHMQSTKYPQSVKYLDLQSAKYPQSAKYIDLTSVKYLLSAKHQY